MRLDIRYMTRFDYAGAVRESSNELRACPISDHRQQLVSYRLTTTPSARVLSTYDYWGTRVDAFGVRVPHGELEIVAEATVETQPAPEVAAAVPVSALHDPVFADRHAEYLAPSPHAEWGEGIRERARQHAAEAGDDVPAVVMALHRAASAAVTYTPGSTYVGVAVEDVLTNGEGVCQDFAHLAVAMCRSLAIPARYASGYLFTVDDATGEDSDTDVVEVQTHAWFEAAIPGWGWLALDPTNEQPITERHVKIGHGRDYDDVPPLKGAFSGPGEHDLDVRVEMRRTSPASQQQSQQQ